MQLVKQGPTDWLTLEWPFVHALQNSRHTKECEGQVEVPMFAEVGTSCQLAISGDEVALRWDAVGFWIKTRHTFEMDLIGGEMVGHAAVGQVRNGVAQCR